jgi:hypothetical protein
MNATENEAKVLRAIATNFYNECNGGTPATFEQAANPVWLELINDAGMPSGIDGRSLSGVCSNLAQKGFANSDAECTWLTQAGWDAMLEHFGGHEATFAGND